jgi:AcrR family transcriptional regulator
MMDIQHMSDSGYDGRVTTPQPTIEKGPNRDDPRFRRTRELICAATRDLLTSESPGSLTFAKIARVAGVNRSTVHQHYRSVHELVGDALATDLAGIARLDRCPMTASSVSGPPVELTAMFAAAAEQRRVLDRLNDTARCLVTDRLAQRLAAQLHERYATTTVDPYATGRDGVPAAVRADFVAGGLVRLLLGSEDQHSDDLARQAWILITEASASDGPADGPAGP